MRAAGVGVAKVGGQGGITEQGGSSRALESEAVRAKDAHREIITTRRGNDGRRRASQC